MNFNNLHDPIATFVGNPTHINATSCNTNQSNNSVSREFVAPCLPPPLLSQPHREPSRSPSYDLRKIQCQKGPSRSQHSFPGLGGEVNIVFFLFQQNTFLCFFLEKPHRLCHSPTAPFDINIQLQLSRASVKEGSEAQMRRRRIRHGKVSSLV